MFVERVVETPDSVAFRWPRSGTWASSTWTEVKRSVDELAAGLLALGISAQDRVAIVASTRIEWLYADLAIMCAGAATTAVYPTSAAADVAYMIADSGSRIVFAEDDAQLAKLRAHRGELPQVVRVVTFDGQSDGEWITSLDDLQRLGADHLGRSPDAVDAAVSGVSPDHLATVMYTSGTTGRPKGVELPHRCWTYVGAAVEALDLVCDQDLHYLWLPLSHAFGKMLEAAQLQIGFCSAVDGRVEAVADNLATIRPTFLAGPPRIYEKVYASARRAVQDEGGVKARLVDWAFGVGGRMVQIRAEGGRRPSPALRLRHAIADRLVLSRFRDRLGGRIRYLISGSAALSPDIVTWFHAAGLPVLEGYGLTETSAATTIARPGDPIGTVGSPLPGTEIRIAEDGEILVRGPAVMRSYHGLPAATADVLSAEGWFATGDIGELDPAGRLRITDRKKDLVKTSGGKYIAPQPVEVMFKAICPLTSHMLVHADGRNYATALVALDPDALEQWGRAHGLTVLDHARLTRESSVDMFVRSCLTELNSRLNRWETIKDFRILDRDLSIEAGELTPSLKIKRKVIESRYRSLLDAMYQTETGHQTEVPR